jgi:hypothetical protein
MKSNTLNRKVIEHLLIVGYKLTDTIEKTLDAPFLIFNNNEIKLCYSANEFRDNSCKLITGEKLLKLRPKTEVKEIKKLSKREQEFYKLLKLLNNSKNSNITGYDVSWTIQKKKYEDYRWEILPISPSACGLISMEHLELILNFAKEHQWVSVSISYTNWSEEKERYGTYTPCVCVS